MSLFSRYSATQFRRPLFPNVQGERLHFEWGLEGLLVFRFPLRPPRKVASWLRPQSRVVGAQPLNPHPPGHGPISQSVPLRHPAL